MDWQTMVTAILIPVVGGQFALIWSIRREQTERVTRVVSELHARIDVVNAALAQFQVAVAREYVSAQTVDRLEERLTKHMDEKFKALGREIERFGQRCRPARRGGGD